LLWAFFCIISVFIATAVSEPSAPDGFWLDAKWLQDGKILLTGANYRGLYIWSESGLDTISTDWKAGYRPEISTDGKVTFTGYAETDGDGVVHLYNLSQRKSSPIYNGYHPGPPVFTPGGDIAFSDGEEIFIYSVDGELIDEFPGGAYLIAALENGFLWCDRDGRAFRIDGTTGDILPVALDFQIKSEKYIFAPKASTDGRFIVAEELGGSMILFDTHDLSVRHLPIGDTPRFVDNPFGIMFMRLLDDGTEIIDNNLYFFHLDEEHFGEIFEVFKSNPPDMIIINADYSPEFGLLVVSRDGRVFRKELDIKDFK
jgi:hypothetical protein